MKMRRLSFFKIAPVTTLLLLTFPVLAGIWGTVVPAFSNHANGFQEIISWPGLSKALWISFKTGLISTLLSVIIVLLIIAMLQGSRLFNVIERCIAPILAIPHAAAALGLAFLITPSGWIFRMISPWLTGWEVPPDLLILNDPGGWALTFGLVSKEVPFLFLMALGALPQTDMPRRMIVAQSLGAGHLSAFMVGVLPTLYRQLRLPVYAVLTYAMTNVEMAMILGPNLPSTLSVQVVKWMNNPTLLHQGTASAGSLIQLGALLATFGLWRLLEKGSALFLLYVTYNAKRALWADGIARISAISGGVICSGALILGLLGLALWSFTKSWQFPDVLPESYSVNVWFRSAAGLFETTITTLKIALLSTFCAITLTISCLEAEHRFNLSTGTRALWIIYIPLIIPGVAFLPGLQLFALYAGVEGNWYAVAFAHLVFVLPYVFLSLAPPYREWDTKIADIGASLGASSNRILWRLRLPMLIGPILTATAVGMAVSIGQYLPSLLIGGGRVETITTEAIALSSGGNRRLVGVYVLLQMILPTIFFALALLVPALAFKNRQMIRQRYIEKIK